MTTRRTEPVIFPVLAAVLAVVLFAGTSETRAGAEITIARGSVSVQKGAEPEPSAEPEASPEDDPTFGKTRSRTPETAFGGGHYVIGENEYHEGDFVLFGGTADIRGVVTGSLVLFGAQATVSGRIHQDVVSIASRVTLTDTAKVEGESVNILGQLHRSEGADIRSQVVDMPFIDLSMFGSGHSFLMFVLTLMFWIKLLKAAFLLLAVVVLTAVFTDRIAFGAEVLPRALGRSFLWGLLCWIVVVLATVLMAVTVIGLPLAILSGLAFKLVCWAGVAVVCCAMGTRVGRNVLGREIRPFAATLLGFLLLAIIYMIPLVGGLLMGVVTVMGLGVLTITRLATREPVKNGGKGAVPPPAPPPPAHAPVPTTPAI